MLVEFAAHDLKNALRAAPDKIRIRRGNFDELSELPLWIVQELTRLAIGINRIQEIMNPQIQIQRVS